jgi:hypothetical protein
MGEKDNLSNSVTPGTIDPVRTLLMPISQMIAWYWVTKYQHDVNGLYYHVMYIAIFYCLWAIYNTVIQHQSDLGVYTMGLVALLCYYHYSNRLPSSNYMLCAIGLVWLNFVLPSYILLFAWDAKKLAKVLKNNTTPTGITWAYIFKAYFVSNIILWSFIFYRFYQLIPQS